MFNGIQWQVFKAILASWLQRVGQEAAVILNVKWLDSGTLVLAPGRYDFKVETKGRPSQLWLDQIGTFKQVCHGDVDYMGVTPLEDGFVLHVQVNSNSLEVGWLAICAD